MISMAAQILEMIQNGAFEHFRCRILGGCKGSKKTKHKPFLLWVKYILTAQNSVEV